MILVLGSLNVDLIARVERLPRPGETVTGLSFASVAGGKGANQALAACKAGTRTFLSGAVGNDSLAHTATDLLKQGGVDLSLVRSVAAPTRTALVVVGDEGENQIAVVPGANGLLTETDAEETLATMESGDVLLLQLEIPASVVERAIELAHERGVTAILNLAPVTKQAARLGRTAEVVIANETEFELLAGHRSLTRADREATLLRMHSETRQTLIVTLGADGVVAVRDGKLYREEGLDIEPEDTVGAGDTFCGYFAACMEQGMDFRMALRHAAVAGSLACLTAGAQPSIPSRIDVSNHVNSAVVPDDRTA